ncbi:hypothetical protein IU449_12935 [Nocardia higoensis]|uniref:DUF4190 domain-containing protein n=1 Tax=Nocardia higoensis TaxID=228599 RepID=A0ABS0DAC4_9NOCA|nr:hypothetical protein [Nocardia higoensis]MBF6355437.1 hypothetical protein [Nocardia higoensis]
MTTPEDPRPGIDLGKPGPDPAQADPTLLAQPSGSPMPQAPAPGFGGAGDQVPGTPPSAYPSYPSYPAQPAPPGHQASYGSGYGPHTGYPSAPGYAGRPPHAAPPPPSGSPYPAQGGFAPAPPPGPYGAPYPGAYVPPPVYSPPGVPTAHGYQEQQTPIFSIISFALAAASVAAIVMLCGFPALFTAPVGIVLGIIGHNKKESLGLGAAITNGVILALVLVVILFVAGAIWSV